MRNLTSPFTLRSAIAIVVGLAVQACWVEPHRSAPPAPASQTPRPDDPPPRVAIDTDRSLHAEPGGGAGVFVTYSAGGTWKIFWTCDTNLVPQHRCNFELAVGTHGVSEIASQPAAAVIAKDAESFQVKTITTTTIDSVTFRTAPGGGIALTMRIDGKVMPSLIWYVSDGKLTKAPSDPIELIPSSP